MLQFLSSPLLGALSDVYGRKPILLLSIAGTLLSYAVSFFKHCLKSYGSKVKSGINCSTDQDKFSQKSARRPMVPFSRLNFVIESLSME